MNEFKKLENETEEQYLWKIGQLVDSGKIEQFYPPLPINPKSIYFIMGVEPLDPKIVEPMRTMVLPSSIATR